MTSVRNVGRGVGALVLVHLAGGLILPYVLLNRMGPPGGFLENAVANAGFVRGAVFLFLLAAAVVLAISITAYPVLREPTRRLALTTLALGIANLALQCVESGLVLSMLSVSQQYVTVGATAGGTIRAISESVEATRLWVHFIQLIVVVSWIFVLFLTLWRARQIPCALGVAGLVTSALQIYGVPVRALLGFPGITTLAIPLAPVYAALALWLMVKGFTIRT